MRLLKLNIVLLPANFAILDKIGSHRQSKTGYKPEKLVIIKRIIAEKANISLIIAITYFTKTLSLIES